MNITLNFHQAEPEDLQDIKALLEEHDLPVSDIEQSEITFYVLREGHGLMACAGIERFGTDALLRSVAVLPELMGKGIGSAFIDFLLSEIPDKGIEGLYLLTETAEAFFSNKGFTKIERKTVPELVVASSEFSELCPSTAVCMYKKV